MKTYKIVILLTALIFVITKANPVQEILIGELRFENDEWIIEKGSTSLSLNGYYLKTNSDSAYFKDDLCPDDPFCLITKDDMESSLYINHGGDTLQLCDSSGNVWEQISFGEKGEVAAPSNGQSICAGYSEDMDIIHYLDNSPTIGAENDTVNACGNVAGVVTDTLGNPLNAAKVIYEIYYPMVGDPDTSYVETNGEGEFKFRRIARKTTLDVVKSTYKGKSLTVQIQPDSTVVVDTIELNGPVTKVDQASAVKNFELSQNFPNPFNPETTIKYKISGDANYQLMQTTLKIYDILGNEVRTLVNKQQTPGSYEITFHAGNLPSGVYLYQLTIGEFEEVKKMVLAK